MNYIEKQQTNKHIETNKVKKNKKKPLFNETRQYNIQIIDKTNFLKKKDKERKKEERSKLLILIATPISVLLQNNQTENSGSMKNHAQTECLFHSATLLF